MLQRIDLGAKFLVRNDAVWPGVIAGREDGAVDVCRSGKRGVVVAKKDAAVRESGQRQRTLGCDEIGPHAVPHDHDDMLGVRRGEQVTGGKKEQREE